MQDRVIALLSIRDEVLLLTQHRLFRAKVETSPSIDELKFSVFDLDFNVSPSSGFYHQGGSMSISGTLSISLVIDQSPHISETCKRIGNQSKLDKMGIELFSNPLKLSCRQKQMLVPTSSNALLPPADHHVLSSIISTTSANKTGALQLANNSFKGRDVTNNSTPSEQLYSNSQLKITSGLGENKRRTGESYGLDSDDTLTKRHNAVRSPLLTSPPQLLRLPTSVVDEFHSKLKDEMNKIELRHKGNISTANAIGVIASPLHTQTDQAASDMGQSFAADSGASVKKQIDSLMLEWGDDCRFLQQVPSRQQHIEKIRGLIAGNSISERHSDGLFTSEKGGAIRLARNSHIPQNISERRDALLNKMTAQSSSLQRKQKSSEDSYQASSASNTVPTEQPRYQSHDTIKHVETEAEPRKALNKLTNPSSQHNQELGVASTKAMSSNNVLPSIQVKTSKKLGISAAINTQNKSVVMAIGKKEKLAQIKNNLDKIEIIPADLLSNKETIEYELSEGDGSDGRSRDDLSVKKERYSRDASPISIVKGQPSALPEIAKSVLVHRSTEEGAFQYPGHIEMIKITPKIVHSSEQDVLVSTQGRRGNIATLSQKNAYSKLPQGTSTKQEAIDSNPILKNVEYKDLPKKAFIQDTPTVLASPRLLPFSSSPPASPLEPPPNFEDENRSTIQPLFTNSIIKASISSSISHYTSNQLIKTQVQVSPMTDEQQSIKGHASTNKKPSAENLKAFLTMLDQKFDLLRRVKRRNYWRFFFYELKDIVAIKEDNLKTEQSHEILRMLSSEARASSGRVLCDFLFDFKFWITLDRLCSVTEAASEILGLRRALSNIYWEADRKENMDIEADVRAVSYKVNAEHSTPQTKGGQATASRSSDIIEQMSILQNTGPLLNNIEPEDFKEQTMIDQIEESSVTLEQQHLPSTRLDDLSIKKILIVTKTLVTQRVYMYTHELFGGIRRRSDQKKRRSSQFIQRIMHSKHKFDKKMLRVTFDRLAAFAALSRMIKIYSRQLLQEYLYCLRQFNQDKDLLACTASEITLRDDSIEMSKKQSAKKFQLAQYIQTHLNPTLRGDREDKASKERRSKDHQQNTLEDIRNELSEMQGRKLEDYSGFSRQLYEGGSSEKFRPYQERRNGAEDSEESPLRSNIVHTKIPGIQEKLAAIQMTERAPEEGAPESHRATLRGSGKIDFDTFKKGVNSDSGGKIGENSDKELLKWSSCQLNIASITQNICFKQDISEHKNQEEITPIYTVHEDKEERPDSAMAQFAAALKTSNVVQENSNTFVPLHQNTGFAKQALLASKPETVSSPNVSLKQPLTNIALEENNDSPLPKFTDAINMAVSKTSKDGSHLSKSHKLNDKNNIHRGESQIEKIQANLNYLERIYKDNSLKQDMESAPEDNNNIRGEQGKYINPPHVDVHKANNAGKGVPSKELLGSMEDITTKKHPATHYKEEHDLNLTPEGKSRNQAQGLVKSEVSSHDKKSLAKDSKKETENSSKDWKPPLARTKTQENYKNFFKKIDSAKKTEQKTSPSQEIYISTPPEIGSEPVLQKNSQLSNAQSSSASRTNKPVLSMTSKKGTDYQKLTLMSELRAEKADDIKPRPHSTQSRQQHGEALVFNSDSNSLRQAFTPKHYSTARQAEVTSLTQLQNHDNKVSPSRKQGNPQWNHNPTTEGLSILQKLSGLGISRATVHDKSESKISISNSVKNGAHSASKQAGKQKAAGVSKYLTEQSQVTKSEGRIGRYSESVYTMPNNAQSHNISHDIPALASDRHNVSTDRKPHIKIKDVVKSRQSSAKRPSAKKESNSYTERQPQAHSLIQRNPSDSKLGKTLQNLEDNQYRADKARMLMDSSVKSGRTSSVGSVERRKLDNFNDDYKRRYQGATEEIRKSPTYVKISEAKKKYFGNE